MSVPTSSMTPAFPDQPTFGLCWYSAAVFLFVFQFLFPFLWGDICLLKGATLLLFGWKIIFCVCVPQILHVFSAQYACLPECAPVCARVWTHTHVLCNLSVLVWISVPLTVWGLFFVLLFFGKDVAFSSVVTEAEFGLEEMRLSMGIYRKCHL